MVIIILTKMKQRVILLFIICTQILLPIFSQDNTGKKHLLQLLSEERIDSANNCIIKLFQDWYKIGKNENLRILTIFDAQYDVRKNENITTHNFYKRIKPAYCVFEKRLKRDRNKYALRSNSRYTRSIMHSMMHFVRKEDRKTYIWRMVNNFLQGTEFEDFKDTSYILYPAKKQIKEERIYLKPINFVIYGVKDTATIAYSEISHTDDFNFYSLYIEPANPSKMYSSDKLLVELAIKHNFYTYFCFTPFYSPTLSNHTNIVGLKRQLLLCAISRNKEFYIVKVKNGKATIYPLEKFIAEQRGVDFEFCDSWGLFD